MSAIHPSSPPTLYLWGAKGGVGTSTVAAVLAVHASRRRPVELRATTPEGLEFIFAGLEEIGWPRDTHDDEAFDVACVARQTRQRRHHLRRPPPRRRPHWRRH